MGRLETTGLDDQDHLAVIGAALKGSAFLPQLTRVTPQWLVQAPNLGVSQPAEELDFVPLTKFDKTMAAAGDIDDRLEALPQRPFRGERVILAAMHFTAGPPPVVTDALWRLIITPAMYVGAVQVGATQGDMPGIAFAATSFGVRLSFPAAGQGTRIYIPFHLDAMLIGERLIVSGGIFGRAVR